MTAATVLHFFGQPLVTERSNILDIEVPPQLEHNIPTGWQYIDHLFAGDGITPGTVALITGTAGAGKTSMGLLLADAITSTGNIAIYNTGEESLYQIRKTARRLSLRNGFIPGYESTVQDIIKRAKRIQGMHLGKQVFLFVDSLQCVDYEAPKSSGNKKKRGRPAGLGNKEVRVVEALAQWAKDTFGVVFIIGQVNKKGEFAGKNAIRHIVDAHFHMEMANTRTARELDLTPGDRIAMMEKNRNGVAGIAYCYEILPTGIKFETDNNASIETS